MIVSLNWLKKYADIDMPVEELATLVGARLVEIEEVIAIGAKYRGVLVVKVVEAEKLEGSDHLSVTKIDDGGFAKNVERDVKGLVQVVCGAPNVKAGQLVVWLPPESIVPNTYGKAEPFVLGTRELRGVMSNGMIASARELDLFDEHEGILEVDKDVKPGESFIKAYELDDYLLDIENKSLTHRPDAFGIVGFAREVAAISGKSFKTPEWLMNLKPDFKSDPVNKVNLKVAIDDPELSARYTAIVMSGADGSKKAPMQVQTYLARVGVRPINAVVDVTNYLMMLTGQPLHAFDYDKLVKVAGGNVDIHVRGGREKEKLELLDGRTIELTSDDIVIAAGETAIGLAGAMGGANTAIDENTKNIIIESATFNLYNLRATQMRHGIFSEAVTRFTKGQSADQAAPVLFEAVRLMNEWAGAESISEVAEVYPGKQDQITIDVETDKINGILGSSLNDEIVAKTMKNVEFAVDQVKPGLMKMAAPYWRADIHIVQDIAEEIGRLNGFDNITPILPVRDFTAVRISDFDVFRSHVRKILVRAGADDVLTYNFIHGDVLEKVGQDVNNSYRIANSISPNLQYYRQTLTPSLLDLVHMNVRHGYDNFALFEINKSHSKLDGMTDEKVPVETDRLALVVVNKNGQPGAPYYQAKRVFDYLCEQLGFDVIYQPIEKESDHPVKKPFEYRRSANLLDAASGLCVGVVGEYKTSVSREFKLPSYTSGFEIDARALFNAAGKLGRNYTPLSRYPASERDICYQVEANTSYSKIVDATKKALESVKLETSVSPVDIYQPDGGKTKNVTIRIRLNAHDHTLTSDEVTTVINSLIVSTTTETGAIVI